MGKKIDVGCGGGRRPAAGYDMYCDKFMPKDPPKPFVKCPMEDMPFGDKEFDWARCWHVIEHTTDPAKACDELMRIAEAGVIAFPPPQAEMLFGRREHNFYVFPDRGRLLFVPKWHRSLGIPRAVTRCELNVTFEWEGSFQYQVVDVDGCDMSDIVGLR